jgi:hypothetical protein
MNWRRRKKVEQTSREVDQLRQLVLQDYRINLEDGGLRFLPDLKRLSAFADANSDEGGGGLLYVDEHPLEPLDAARMAASHARMKEVKACRRMFRTAKNYLGMGPKSV